MHVTKRPWESMDIGMFWLSWTSGMDAGFLEMVINEELLTNDTQYDIRYARHSEC